MKSISVIIDEHSKYSIDLKDEYQVNEFIEYFEGQIQKIKKISPSSSPYSVPAIANDTIFKRNVLFTQIDVFVRGLGSDIEMKDNNTMRTYTSIIKSKNKRKGLVWLKPVSNSLVIHLRPGDYSEVDKKGEIAYSEPGKTTFGNYPTLKINESYDPEYILRIILYAYQTV